MRNRRNTVVTKDEVKAKALKVFKKAWPFLAGIFVVLGCVFAFVFEGCDTLAIVSFVAAGIFLAFILIELAMKKFEFVGKEFYVVLKFLSIAVSCIYIATVFVLLYGAHDAEDMTAEYAIVMGADIGGDAQRAVDERLERALLYLEENPGVIAVLSGGEDKDLNGTAADYMYAWLTERGIAPERLVKDTEAVNSYQTMHNSFAVICGMEGLDMEEIQTVRQERTKGNQIRKAEIKEILDQVPRIAVITNEYNLIRSKYVADSVGFATVNVGTDTAGGLIEVNEYFREAVALWIMMIMGED